MEFKLILKKLNNSLTAAEELTFEKWYQENNEHKLYFDKVRASYSDDIDIIDIEEGWRNIAKKIDKPRRHTSKFWKVAAAIFAGFLLATFLYTNRGIEKRDNEIKEKIVVQPIDIKPGINKAVLTLGDGTQIALEKGSSYQEGAVRSNGEEIIYNSTDRETSKVAYNYLTIPSGGQFQIILSDGTKVWLNSETQLKYPEKFLKDASREVEIVYGEAFFNVSSSNNHGGNNFKVYHKGQEVEVLGTQFNIKAYSDENAIYTTLAEGSVNIDYNGESWQILPSEQLTINKSNNEVHVAVVDVYNEISWKDGVFSFEDKTLKEISKVLARWYDVEFVFNSASAANETFVGKLGKEQTLQEILSNIKTFGIIKKFTIDEKKIILE